MPTNFASGFQADIEAYIADKTLPLARRQLVVYQFGDPLTLPKGRGQVYTATRFNRVPLPYAPLSEGVPPVGEVMTLSQVTATALQWGDKITITDVAELTIKHPLFRKATELLGLQVAETYERNTFNNLMGGAQVNTVNARGARGSLQAGDVLNIHELNRASAMLVTLGAPRFMGDEMTDTKLDADAGGARASTDPRRMPHYVAVIHPFVAADLRENQSIQYAWSHSDINRLYNYEVGEWSGIRFCMTNLVPSITGVTAITGTAGTAGSLPGAPSNYVIQVTASDTQNQYESQVYGVSGSIAVTGPNGSISVVLPTLPGYTFNVYVSVAGSSSPINLGLTTSGPTSGPLQGQATQLAGGQTVVITGVGASMIPPAAPANTITVYPNFIFGRGAYGQVVLDDTKFTYLKEADKSDPLNQLRVVGWKCMYGTILLNQQFMMRIESTSAFNATFA
jgi:N4-gp56 family major capsid protein